jgi:hypothetical protein
VDTNECKTELDFFSNESIIGMSVVLETEESNRTTIAISLKMDRNYFRDNFCKKYNELKLLTVTHLREFLQGVAKNIGISHNAINFSNVITDENWDELRFLNKSQQEDYWNPEESSKLIATSMAISESPIYDSYLHECLWLHYIDLEDPKDIIQHGYGDRIVFQEFLRLRKLISRKTSIISNEKYLSDYLPEFFDWDIISSSSKIGWTTLFIKKFIDKLNFDLLSLNPCLPWSDEFIEEFADKWNWVNLSRNTAIEWDNKLISKFRLWVEWKFYSANPNLPWGVDFIEEYLNQWDWEALSLNKGIPWSEELIGKFCSLLDWNNLCANDAIFWDDNLLTKYMHRINWGIISNNRGSFWTPAILMKFCTVLDSQVLSQNTALPWTFEIFVGLSDVNFFRKKRIQLFDEEILNEIDGIRNTISDKENEEDYKDREFGALMKQDDDYYSHTTLDVILGIRNLTADELFDQAEREKLQQEDDGDYYERMIEAQVESLISNPLLNSIIWNKIYGGIYDESFLYDVLDSLERHKSGDWSDFPWE